MKAELQDKLFNDFPLLFDKDADIRDSCMCFGFECGDGWYKLIRELCEKLYPVVIKFIKDNDDFSTKVTQVKEKYGTLNFYMNYSTDEMEDIIQDYEDRSAKICETCGEPGSIDYNRYWLTSSCDEHRD